MRRGMCSLISPIVMVTMLFGGQALADVGYLGPAGTYTEEAAAKFFGEKETFVPVNTVAETLQLLKAGKFEAAVVPVENTIGGPVYPYLDAVIGDRDFVLVGELNLTIRQTLLVLPGTTLQDVKTVMSHPQGLAQSAGWLKTHLPNAKLVEAPSTSEAARRVAVSGDKTLAAIAASRAGQLYKLETLATDLQEIQTNVTRFWIVTTKPRQKFGHAKAALLVRGPANRLSRLLSDLDQKQFTVLAVHDRPAKTLLGEYLFVVETRGGEQSLLTDIVNAHSANLQIDILGLYDVR